MATENNDVAAGINFNQLFEEKPKRGRKPGARLSMKGPIKEMLQTVYALPGALGYGPWWALSEPEAEAFATQFDRVAAQFPDKTWQRLFKLFEKWAPVGSLAFVAWQINYPRIEATRALMAQLKAQAAAGEPQPAPEAVN